MFGGNKKAWTAAMLTVAMIAVSACAPEREGVGETGNANTEEEQPKQLRIWAHDDANHVEAVLQLTQKYTEQTGIEVKVERVPSGDQVQKLALAAPAGNGPDLFYQPHDRLGDIVAQGLAEPIALDEDAVKGYSSAAADAVRYEGDLYGAPIAIDTYALFYNKDLVAEAPASFEDVIAVGKPLTDPTQDKFGFIVVPDFYYTIPFITNYGGYVFGGEAGNYDVADIGLNSKGTIEGLKRFQQLYKDASLPETMTFDVMDSLFMEGKAGMVVNGLWAIKTYSDKFGDKIGSAPLPTVNGQPAASFVGVKSWFVSSYSEHPQWAADLAAFLTNDENSQLYYETTGEIPARSASMSQITEPLYEGFIKQIESGIPMPNVPEMTAVWEMDKALDFIIKGDDVQAVLKETVDTIEQQIAASGK